MYNNPSLGYYLPDYLPMSYNKWINTIGQYRWVHADGKPRTTYPLDYDWQPIWEEATRQADIYFSNRDVLEPMEFTSMFLARVPMAWLKYKTSLELMSGMLDGHTIDPEYFEAGYERTTSQTGVNNYKTAVSADTSTNIGARTDRTTGDDKQRQLNYLQGVQALDGGINNGNIGTLGNDKASSIVDGVSQSDSQSTQGAQTTTGDTNTNASTDSNTTFNETVREKRYNYYDNLAFLRDRIVLMDKVEPFYNYFNDLFISSNKMTGWW